MFTIDVAIPCNKWQSPTWWGPLMTTSLITAGAGVRIGHVIRATGALTDTARNQNVHEFLIAGSDAIMQVDDDTVVHSSAIYRLAEMNVPIASGVYFGRVDIKAGKEPVPLLYRREEGFYVPIKDYYKGEIIDCDGIGMGCSLIRREVFTAIMEAFVLMERPTGPLLPVHPDHVPRYEAIGCKRYEALMEVKQRDYPFYVFDNGRTEDFFFLELAAQVGYRPIVDTRLESGHVTEYVIDGDDFWDYQLDQIDRRERGSAVRSLLVDDPGKSGPVQALPDARAVVERAEGAAL